MRIGAGLALTIPQPAGGGSATFNGTDVSNCLAWYRASLGVTNVSGAASAWADQSGAGDSNRNATQATALNRPTIVSSDANFNSQQVLSFDGTNSAMTTGTFTGGPYTQPITIYSVFRATAVGFLFLFDDIDGTSRVAFLDAGDTPASPYMFAGLSLVGTSHDMAINTTHVVGLVFNGGSSATYIDHYSTASVSGGAGANGLKSLAIGQKNDGTARFAGRLAELIAYSGAHNATTRQQVMQGLGSIYGVTVSA